MRTIGLDVETTKVPRHHPWIEGALLVAVGIADETGYTKTWVFNHDDPSLACAKQGDMLVEIQDEIKSAGRIVGHNLKFDLNWMNLIGIDYSSCKLYCTMVTEYLLRGQKRGGLSLSDLSPYYGLPDKIDMVKTFWDAGYETTEIPLKILLPYLEQDCLNTLAIFQRQEPKIIAAGQVQLVKIQNETTRTLSNIEFNGMVFNRSTAERHVEDVKQKLAIVDTELKLAFGWDVNLNSGDELSVALFGGVLKREGTEWVSRELKNETKYYERKCIIDKTMQGIGFDVPEGAELKKEGYFSTDKNILKQLKSKSKKHKAVKQWVLDRSQLSKALETFVGDGVDKGLISKIRPDGRIHSSYNQCVTITGRLSSSNPNGQNLPRNNTSPIKQCIEPRNDWIMNADLKQIEWRAAAWLSQDKVMIKEILENVDVHADNAINFFKARPGVPSFDGLRTDAKVMTFRLIYGGSSYGFFMDQSMPRFSKRTWDEIVENFWDKYRGLKAWQDRNLAYVNSHEGLLVSPTKRIFHIQRDKKGGYSRRQVCNYPVQSLATADIMPMAMCLIGFYMKTRGMRSLMIGQVHDSIVFDVFDYEMEDLAKLCISVFKSLPMHLERMFGFKFNVPLDGDIEVGRTYGSLEKLKL